MSDQATTKKTRKPKATKSEASNSKDETGKVRLVVKALAEKFGIRNVGMWVTMGEYDGIAVWDAPDDQAMAAFTLSMASQGILTTRTMRALSEEEFAKTVSKLP